MTGDALDRAAEAAHDTWMHSTRDIYGVTWPCETVHILDSYTGDTP